MPAFESCASLTLVPPFPARTHSGSSVDPGFLAAARARWTFAEQVARTPARQLPQLVARRDTVVHQTDKIVLRRYAKVSLKRFGASSVTSRVAPDHNVTVFSQTPGSSPRLAAADISAEIIRRYGVPATFLLDAQIYINPFEHTAQWIYRYPHALRRLCDPALQRARQRLQLQKSFARVARDLPPGQWSKYVDRLQKAGATEAILDLVEQGRQDWLRLHRRLRVFQSPGHPIEDALAVEWLYQRNLRLSRPYEMRWDDAAVRLLKRSTVSVEARRGLQEATLALEESDANTRLLLRNALVSAGALRVHLAQTDEGLRAGTPSLLDQVAYLNEQLAIQNERTFDRAYDSAARVATLLDRPLDARCYLLLSQAAVRHRRRQSYFQQPTGTRIMTSDLPSDRLLRETARLTVAALKRQPDVTV